MSLVDLNRLTVALVLAAGLSLSGCGGVESNVTLEGPIEEDASTETTPDSTEESTSITDPSQDDVPEPTPSVPVETPDDPTATDDQAETTTEADDQANAEPKTSDQPAPDPILSGPATSSSDDGQEGDQANTEAEMPEAAEGEADTTPVAVDNEQAQADPKIALKTLDFNGYQQFLAQDQGEKLTMVDAWATWCGPCRENFPHVVEMNQKYADQGLQVVSLSLDDPTDEKALKEAKQFLREQQANFPNILLDADFGSGEAFEQLDIINIPSVFIYNAKGEEIHRFVGDDPNEPYTYEDVEAKVAELLQK